MQSRCLLVHRHQMPGRHHRSRPRRSPSAHFPIERRPGKVVQEEHEARRLSAYLLFHHDGSSKHKILVRCQLSFCSFKKFESFIMAERLSHFYSTQSGQKEVCALSWACTSRPRSRRYVTPPRAGRDLGLWRSLCWVRVLGCTCISFRISAKQRE